MSAARRIKRKSRKCPICRGAKVWPLNNHPHSFCYMTCNGCDGTGKYVDYAARKLAGVDTRM